MSLFVYAGASQMVALGLIASGQSVVTIVLTTFLINLRLLLLGAAITPIFTGWSRKLRILFGLQLTDETFAALAARFQGVTADRVVDMLLEKIPVEVQQRAAKLAGK